MKAGIVLKSVFVNRHDEIRSGFRLTMFVLVAGTLEVLLILPVQEVARFVGDSGIILPLITLGSTFAGSYIMTRFVNRKPWSAIGVGVHPTMFRELGMGCLLGFLMMTGIFLVEYYSGFVGVAWRGLSVWQCLRSVAGSALLFILAAASEELLFRGYLFQTLIQAITFLPAMLVLSCIFSLAHWRNPNMTTLALVNIALAGVCFSIAYMKTRSLWLPLGLHFAWNFSQTTIFSFPTSGLEFDSRMLFRLTQSGPEWLTGGLFGPEGGLLATAALLLCTGYILKSDILTEPEGIITFDSIEDLLEPSDGAEGESG